MIALAEATDSALREVALGPLSSRAGDCVGALIDQLDEVLTSRELKMLRQLKPAQRAPVAAEFQRVADNLRVMLSVAEQIKDLGGQSPPWSIPLAEAIQRLRRRLKERGLPIGPPRRPIPKVVRDESTGEFRVFDPADLERLVALTSATTSLGNALLQNWSPTRPLAETAPATAENLRKLLATVTPERLQHLDAQRAALAARVLDQTREHVQRFLVLTGQLGQQGEVWFTDMTSLLGQVEIALARLHSIEAADAQSSPTPNRSEQQLREAGVRLLPSKTASDVGDEPALPEEESFLTIRPRRPTIWIHEAVPILAPRRPHIPAGDVLDEDE